MELTKLQSILFNRLTQYGVDGADLINIFENRVTN